MDKIAVLIPCYNESATIAKVIADYRAVLPEATIYVYDNNSSDGTDKIARAAGAEVRYEHRQGKGNVIRSMFRDIEADCYLMIDGDDTYPAENARDMVGKVLDDGYDMVIGDRPRLLHPRDPVQLVRAADRDHADPADRPARLDDAARAQRKPRFHGRAARRYHSGRYGRKLLHRPDRLYPSAPGARRGQEYRHPQRLPAPRPSGPDDRDDHHPRPRADGILERRGLGDDEADGRRHDDRHGHLDRRDAVHHAGLLLADRQHRRAPEKACSPAAP